MIVATVAVMVFGFVFFLPPVFGARWMALIGRPREQMRPGPEFAIDAAHGLLGQMIMAAIVAAWR